MLFLGFDTSFVAFYGAIVGILLLAAAVFFTFQARPKRALLAALGVMLLAFCLLEARDYVFVKYYRLPPQYSLKIVSEGGRIKYDKLFYDVYRYRSDSGEETYVFAENQ